MNKTKEIRWIFKKNNLSIQHWFDSLSSEKCEQRVDRYLNLNNSCTGIKLRGGNIEVKHCIGSKSKGCLTPEAWGTFEEYIKWSFNVEESDFLFSDILQGTYSDWIAIGKRRKAVTINYEKEEITIYPIKKTLEFGCQLEYTEIELDGDFWYSFGLEWFGKEHIDIKSEFISEILGDTNLNSKESKSYMVFLNELASTS